MDDHFQYPDIPQIPITFSTQGGFGHSYPGTSTTRGLPPYFAEDAEQDGGANPRALNNMRPLQRYLQGTDPPHLAPELLHSLSRIGAQHSPAPGSYEAPWPSSDCVPYSSRNGSPDTTSAISSHNTQNELHSPHHMHSTSFGNTDHYTQNTMSFPHDGMQAESFPTELVLSGNSINLRDIEYHHEEPEPLFERAEFIGTATTAVESEFVPTTETTAVNDDGYIMDTKSDYKSFQDTSMNGMMPVAEEVQPMSTGSEESDSDYNPSSSRSNKRRKSSSSRHSMKQNSRRTRKGSNASAKSPTTKVSKRQRGNTGHKSPHRHSSNDSEPQRPFPCPLAIYGCQSDFASKNEWKRHISTQHVKLGFWRCDLCPTTVDPHDNNTIYHNDFNRKDLFTQHLRRMHAPPPNSSTQNQKEFPVTEDNISEHHFRCYQKLRNAPPRSSCLFCDKQFHSAAAWDECVEHVGRHLEKDRKTISLAVEHWSRDTHLEQWLLNEGLIERERDGAWKIGSGKPLRETRGAHEDK